MKIFIQFDRQFEFFLTKKKISRGFEFFLDRNASVKDIIESFGVPHTEIGNLYFNHQKIDFSFIPGTHGILDVHGITPPFNVQLSSNLRPKPFNTIKFIADVNVIRLGKLMILLGFDVDLSSSNSDNMIAQIAKSQSRIVLTRDTALLKRNKIVYARRIRENMPWEQLVETITFFGLEGMISFFSRCTACNIKLAEVEKKKVLHLLEPKTKRYFHTFFQCPQCKKVFWKGSHYDNICQKISSIGISINH